MMYRRLNTSTKSSIWIQNKSSANGCKF
jgi:hypothetical protein